MKKTASNDLINPKNESLINNHNFNPLTTPKSSRMSKSCKGYCTNNYSEKFSATTKSSNTLNLASTSKESSRDFKESNIISSRKNNVESIRGSFDENNAATSFTSLISIGKPNNLLMVPASVSTRNYFYKILLRIIFDFFVVCHTKVSDLRQLL